MRWFFKRDISPLTGDQQHQAQLEKIATYPRFILLKVSRCGCKSSIQQMDQVYPIDAPPSLPFVGCDAPICHCTYEGIVDRRAGKVRRHRVERRNSIRNDSDRRLNHGRRKGDRLISYQHY